MKKLLYTILLLLFCTSSIVAQPIRSIYFSEQNPLRHQLNAAFAPKSGYISFPFLSNISLGTTSNIALKSLLYPAGDGTLNTFLSSAVSASEFENNIDKNNQLGINFSMDLLSTGFYKWGGFNTLTFSIASEGKSNVSEDLFLFLKKGMDDPNGVNYDLKNTGLYMHGYGQVALGHSRQITDKLRVGAKLKFLLGVASTDISFENMALSMSENKWMIESNGKLYSTGIKFGTRENGEIDTDKMVFNPGINGFGMAVDLGASYQLNKNLGFSLAVNDLGFMSWKSDEFNSKADPFEFSGFDDVALNDDSVNSSIDDQLDNLSDDIEELFSFYQYKMGGKTIKSCATTINGAAEYGVLNNRISFGMLFTAKVDSPYSWVDLMASVNFRPANWFYLGLNVSVSDLGCSYGTLINFNAKRFNFFVGANAMSLKVAAGDIPVPIGGLTYQANFGMNFMIARNRDK